MLSVFTTRYKPKDSDMEKESSIGSTVPKIQSLK